MSRRIASTLGVVTLVGIAFISNRSTGIHQRGSRDSYSFYASLDFYSVLSFAIALMLVLIAVNFSSPSRTNSAAGVMRRFLAFLIDFTIYFQIVLLPVTLVVLLFEAHLVGELSFLVRRDFSRPTDYVVTLMVLVASVSLAYFFALPIHKECQSPGGIITRSCVQSDEPLSIHAAFWRAVFGYFTLCAAILSVPSALKREDRRFWHDRSHGTRVVLVDDGSA